MNVPENHANEEINHKVCNAINCYYSNEYLLGAGYDYVNKQTQNCRFCAYNFDDIHALRKFISFELNKPKKNINKFFRKSFYSVVFVVSTIFVLIGVIIYNFDNIKSFFK